MAEGCIYLRYRWHEENGIFEKIYELCNSTLGLRVIRFFNPDDYRDNKDILMCETHFHETFDPMTRPIAKAESNVNAEKKRLANVRKDFIDKRDFEMLRQFNANPEKFHKLDTLKRELQNIRDLCAHPDCENSTRGRARKFFSISIYTLKGASMVKINFCSFECWNKVRLYIGMVRKKPPLTKASTLEAYMG